MEPLGVVGLITPWNANAGFICGKLAMVIASGSTCVIKPSEMSAIQTSIVLEALHEAGVPHGVFNVVNGRGDVVGAELSESTPMSPRSASPDRPSPAAPSSRRRRDDEARHAGAWRQIPMVILDDADFAEAIPFALAAGFNNSGQACIAGTQILVPASRLVEFETAIKAAVATIKSGHPRDPATAIGPMVSQRQRDRVQSYIRKGVEEGATLLIGGEGFPKASGKAGSSARPSSPMSATT